MVSIANSKGVHSSVEEHLQLLVNDFKLVNDEWVRLINEYEYYTRVIYGDPETLEKQILSAH
jgi:hypothetical protein